MLTRRNLLAATAALAAATQFSCKANAATPKNVIVMGIDLSSVQTGFDPAEGFDYALEVMGNLYRTLIEVDPDDTTKLIGDLAESWQASSDGRDFKFLLKKGQLFSSGSEVTADDVVFSLQRVVKLQKGPSFLLTQFGWDGTNVDAMIRVGSPGEVLVTTPNLHAPKLLLSCLTNVCGSIVEKAAVLANEEDDDLGNKWLKRNSAGTGSYILAGYQPAESILLQANQHAKVVPSVPRFIIRHVPDPATQMLLLEKGDLDIARGLTADQLTQVRKNSELSTASGDGLVQMYIGMDKTFPPFQKTEVLQAIKWAIDYDALATNLTPGIYKVWQSFQPKGIPGALGGNPFKKDIAKAKALMEAGGYPDGFTVTFDHFNTRPVSDIAQAIQADLAQIGIKLELLPAEKGQVYAKEKARTTKMEISLWVPDYLDPNSNAQWFGPNVDDSDQAKLTNQPWTSHFVDEELTRDTAAAAVELDDEKRLEIYERMQRAVWDRAPYIFMLQEVQVAGLAKGVAGIKLGLLPGYTRYARTTKA